ncbi:hypothetical protein [Pseudomonas sp. HMWF021]|uniref:hypothetical protein n=1 Tax=Pseudomonas sp. HMWF021 TaxID=2056857 RepID=UPI000D364496|nr:hypothetical protein [Pseudomonas sp. HMWF021]PTT24604.1 hypothetical protein DBR18_26925 [Pseudomonas sp. HMWF021]
MLKIPSLDSNTICAQIKLAEDMLLVTQMELKNVRHQMIEAKADELRAKALIEFLGRTDERKNNLYPFSSFRDNYMSAGFGGIKVEELDEHMDYLNLVISNARSKENEAQSLENLEILLKKDIDQLRTVASVGFRNYYNYLAVKDIWWGQSALCNPHKYSRAT